MTFQPCSIQPPRIAIWFLSLFTRGLEADSIHGDLLEEFSHLAAKSGVAFARRWYWRQCVKTIAHLVGAAFQVDPWSTFAAVVIGFVLKCWLLGRLETAIFAILERCEVPDHHFSVYAFFASTGIHIGRVIVTLFVGAVVALVAKGREMTATMTLGAIFGALAITGTLVLIARTEGSPFLWTLGWSLLAWSFADSFAMVVGGAIIIQVRRTVEGLSSKRTTLKTEGLP